MKPYIPYVFYEKDEFSYARLSKLNENQLLEEGIVSSIGKGVGAIGKGFVSAAKTAAKGAQAVGKWAGKVKSFVAKIGGTLKRNIELTKNNQTSEYQKMATESLENLVASLRGKKMQESSDMDIRGMVSKIISIVKPNLENYLKKNDKTGIANFIAIMALNFLEKILAPNAAVNPQEPQEKDVTDTLNKFQVEMKNQITPLLK